MSVQLSEEDAFLSKMATEKGLLDIGRAMLLKEQEIETKAKFKIELLEEIQSYRTKSALISSKAVVDKFDKFVEISNEEKGVLEKERDGLKEDLEIANEEIDGYLEEVNELEKTVERQHMAIQRHDTIIFRYKAFFLFMHLIYFFGIIYCLN